MHRSTRSLPLSEIARRCEDILVEAARATGLATRRRARRAAHRFVRRHRGNVSYLSFVLRRVLANAAIAIPLLGLGATSAVARTTFFVERTGSANPLNGADIGLLSTPALADLDHDGDLDLASGERYGSFGSYVNVGTATAPSFIIVPTLFVDVGDASAPAYADLDGDGDQDQVVGTAAGTFAYFRNDPLGMIQQGGPANPMNGVDVGSYATATFADLDGDGDLDAIAGEFDGVLDYFENTGSATQPHFVERTGTANPLDGEDVGLFSTPSLADLDGDGDLDLLTGAGDGTFRSYENTGTLLAPRFVLRTGAENPLDGLDVGGRSVPLLADLDGDGDADVLAGESYGSFRFFQNLAGTFALQAANPFAGFDVGELSAPTLGDLDADGDLDLLSGAFNGFFFYFKNTGSAIAPTFLPQTGVGQNPMGNAGVGSRSKPVIADIGHFQPDGKLDVTSGANDGTFHFYLNTGTALAPVFFEQTGSQTNPFHNEDVGANSAPAIGDLDGFIPENVTGENFGTFLVSEPFGTFLSTGWLDGQDVGFYSTPTLADVDGDGDLDLVSGENDGVFDYFENVGNPSAPTFILRNDPASPVAGLDIGLNSAPALGDLDGDGDLDLVSGKEDGTFSFFKNVLIRSWPRYSKAISFPFGSTTIGFFSSPAAGDLDGDGDPDFVAGTSFGNGAIHYFQNTGNAQQPHVLEISGTGNPFNGLNSGSFAHLALGDVDGDGDLDLVAGENYGNPLHYFKNTGSVTNPAFIEQSGVANPFNGVIVGRAVPAFGDVDADGDLDVLVGEFYGTFRYFKNTGTAVSPAFAEQVGVASPFNGLSAVNFSAPALGDVDRDGDLDLLAGEESPGIFHYFENTGTATTPHLVERTGAANPLDGKTVGLNSSPTFVDLDGDGDLDVVSGERYGTFPTYYLPEPGLGSLFAAGGGLLGWLARWRERRRR